MGMPNVRLTAAFAFLAANKKIQRVKCGVATD